MAQYSNLKAYIEEKIYENGTQAITGDILQDVLKAMTDDLGEFYQTGGVALPSTDPGTPDAKVIYFATEAGTYTNFGGITLAAGEVALLVFDTTWTKVELNVLSAANGGVKTANLADGAVTTEKIAGGAVETAKIANNAVTSGKVADGAIGTAKIADGAIDADKIAANAVESAKIKNGAVTEGKINDRAVTADKVAANAVTTAKIADDAVTTAKLNDGAVTEDKIATDAVTSGKVKDGAIGTAKIAAGAVTHAKIGAGAVEESNIKDGAVTSDKIANGAVGSDQLAEGAFSAENLADGSVTTDKLADDAVTAEKIADGAVTAGKFANGSVTTIKLGSGAVTTEKIGDGMVTRQKLADSSVSTSKIIDGAVTTAKVADGNVTTAKIADANVTTGKLADGAVTTAKIADGNITTAKVADGAITDAKLQNPVSVSQNIETGHTEIHIGSDNYPVASVEEIANDFKHIIFRIGNRTDTTILNRAHCLNPMEIRKGDCVVISDIDVSKYNIEIIVRDSTDESNLFSSGWLEDAWKKWHSGWNGLLRIGVKKIDGNNFTNSDIIELDDSNIIIIPKEQEMTAYFADITDTFENGRDYADIDSLDFYSTRVRTGLFAYKCKKGDSISFGKLHQMGYDNISLIAYDDDLTRNLLQSNSENYTFDTSAYIRLSIGPKSGSSSITSTDIENFKNNIKVSRKHTNTYNDSSTYQHLEIVYGCNLDWTTGETVKNIPTRALTQTVLVNRGDRIEIDTLNPSSGIGLLFVNVAMYDKNNAYLGNKSVDKKYYLHEDESCYIRLSLSKDDNTTFVIGEADGKIRLVRNTYNFNNYYLKASMFEIGSISGSTGADADYNYRARTVPYIFTDKPIAVILKNWQDYYFSLAIYSKDKSFIRTTPWNYVPTVGDIELTSPYVVPIVATVSPNNGEYYFRVLLKKMVDAAFTESDIAALDDVIEVKTMDCSYTLPSYYNTEIQSVINRINEKYTPNCFNVVTLTDSHDDLGSQYKEISEYLLNQLKAAVELSKKTNSLFIVHCGDITTGSTGKENILHLSQQILDITSEAKCPVFFVRGNHDDATDVEPKDQRTAESALFGKEFLAKISASGLGELHTIGSLDNNTAYYYDFLKQKVRVIVIDDMVSYPIQESGGYLVYTGGQGNWRGINDNQIQWLLNDALIIPEDYRIILVEHDVTHSKLSGNHYGTSHNFDYYNAIKAAFNGKLSSVILAGSKPSDERGELLPQYNENDEEITYPSWVTAINFSNRTGGNIIAEISGHHHSDTFWKDESGIIQDNVGTCSPYMQWSHWEPEFGLEEGVSSWETDREPQTIKEALMDVLLISPTKANRIRFGAKAVSDTKINEYNM